MKTIYVKITEFWSNGGECEKGRKLYYSDGKQRGLYDGFESNYIRLTSGELLADFLMYVEIEVTPIYK